jgi:hypothetical protein
MGRLKNGNAPKKKADYDDAPSTSTHLFNVADLLTPAESAPIASFVDRPSEDGRSMIREPVRVNPPSPLKRARLGDGLVVTTDQAPLQNTSTNRGDDEPEHRYSMEYDEEELDPELPVPKLPRLPNLKRFLPAVSLFYYLTERHLKPLVG